MSDAWTVDYSPGCLLDGMFRNNPADGFLHKESLAPGYDYTVVEHRHKTLHTNFRQYNHAWEGKHAGIVCPDIFKKHLRDIAEGYNNQFQVRLIASGPNANWVATVGALALSDSPGLVKAVQDFDTFTEDNDPYGEHDFGAIPWQDEKTFWKIDYYDPELQYWHDPLSPDCRRILTVLLASEYCYGKPRKPLISVLSCPKVGNTSAGERS